MEGGVGHKTRRRHPPLVQLAVLVDQHREGGCLEAHQALSEEKVVEGDSESAAIIVRRRTAGRR